MSSPTQLTLWLCAVGAAGALTGCGASTQAADPSGVAASQPQRQANNCRSGWSQTTQKGCAPDLPFALAGAPAR